MYLFLSLALLLGLMVGSFLNVVILRYQTGRITGTRSACLSCSQSLEWFELIPVLSFILLRRRCRHCHSLISWQYPLVELTMGVLFGLLAWQLLSPSLLINQVFVAKFIIQAIVITTLVVVAVYDIRHKIVSDQLIIIALATIFIGQIVTNLLVNLSWWAGLTSTLLTGILIALPLAVLWLLSRGRWLGLGDVKLAIVLGSWLDITQGLSALAVAFWSGALISVSWLLRQRFWPKKTGETSRLSKSTKGLTMKSEVPFAPFLVFGALVSLFWGLDVFSLNLLSILFRTI